MRQNDRIPLTGFGEVLTGQLQCHAAWRFDYGINTRLYKVTTANGGTVTADGNRAKLATNTNVSGSARIETKRRLRYLPGMAGLLRQTAVFSEAKLNSHQYFGIGDGVDGLFYGYNEEMEFVVGKIRDGVYVTKKRAEWNGRADADFNSANGNVFQIRFQWLGYGYLRYYMLDFEDETAGYMKLHTINYPNTSPDVHILNPTLPIFGEVLNSGNNSNIAAWSPSASAFSEGYVGVMVHPLDVFESWDMEATYSDTNNNHMMTIRNKSTFAGVANRVPVQLNSLTFGRGTGAALTRLRIYRDATFAGALTYADVDAPNSPVDVSTTTTTVTSTNSERSWALSGSLPTQEFKPGEIVLQPGETITIASQNSGVQGTQMSLTANWSNLF
jgi:hypothetical protein